MNKFLWMITFLFLTTNSFAQQVIVEVSAKETLINNGRFVCHQDDRWDIMREVWNRAKEKARIKCNSNVSLRERVEETMRCADFGTTLHAEVKATFACVPFDDCTIRSPYCQDSCCD